MAGACLTVAWARWLCFSSGLAHTSPTLSLVLTRVGSYVSPGSQSPAGARPQASCHLPDTMAAVSLQSEIFAGPVWSVPCLRGWPGPRRWLTADPGSAAGEAGRGTLGLGRSPPPRGENSDSSQQVGRAWRRTKQPDLGTLRGGAHGPSGAQGGSPRRAPEKPAPKSMGLRSTSSAQGKSGGTMTEQG